jgi:hypothetical protein
MPQRRGRSLIKRIRIKTSGGSEAFFRVIQNGQNLVSGDTGEPFKKFIHCGVFFEILKKRFYRDACTFKDPCATNPLQVPFNR